MEHEEAFFATFVISFVSMIVFAEGKAEHAGKRGICMEENRQVSQIDGMMGGRAWKAP